MKNKHLILAAVLLGATAVAPARTARDFFVDAPGSVVPLLDRNTRLDMLDYYDSGLQTPSKNTLGGTSRLVSVDPDKVEVQLTAGAGLQIGLAPLRGDTAIVVVETVHTPVADSYVRVYDKSWTPLRADFSLPTVTDFVAPASRRQAADAEMPAMAFMRIEFVPGSGGSMLMHNTTAGYYHESDRPAGLALMRPTLQMRFDGKRIVEIPEKSTK